MPVREGRLLPEDRDSELALLGSMMMDRTVIDDVRPIVPDAAAFATPQHGLIFDALLGVHDAGLPMDLLAVTNELLKREQLAEIGGQDYLIQLSESFADWSNAKYYARQVRRTHQKRRLIGLGVEIQNLGYQASREPDDVLALMAQRMDVIERQGNDDRDSIGESDLLRGMANPSNNQALRVPVCIGALGERLDGGLDAGTLTVIGGRPSTGKTSLGLGLAHHCIESSDGYPALFVSAEMSRNQVAQRLLSMRSGLEVSRIRSGNVDDDQFNRERNKAALSADASVQAGRGLYILDGVTDVRAICSHIKRNARRNRIGLAVLDYLGLFDLRGKFDRHDLKLAAMTRAFKEVATACEMAVVLLVQLSRASEKEKRRPTLGDLRDSGSIEADADNVVLIHKTGVEQNGFCDTLLIVAKQRQGQTGDAPVWYRRATMTYESKFLGPMERCGS